MQAKRAKLVPSLIILGILLIVCILHALSNGFGGSESVGESRLNLLRHLELMTYDARVRIALLFPRPHASNLLGAVFISDKDTKDMNDGSHGYRVKFPWPRYFYGRLVSELASQGAAAVALDIFFDQTDPDDRVDSPRQKGIPSDQFFAEQLLKAGNVVLAADPGGNLLPAPLFETNSLAIGNVYTEVDSDGILRRAKAFVHHRKWHPKIVQMARVLNWTNLADARIDARRITFERTDENPADFVTLGADGNLKFDEQGELLVNQDDQAGNRSPGRSDTNSGFRPFVDTRVWSLGIVLAARWLGLDLANPVIEADRIVLRGPNGLERVIPTDERGFFFVDWAIKYNDPARLAYDRSVTLIRQSEAREDGNADFPSRFRGRLVVVGSTGTGGNISDRGATPIENETVLVSKHWNVANSVLMGSFITPLTFFTELWLTLAFGIVAGALSWNLRGFSASLSVIGIAVVYTVIAILLFVRSRYWLPLFVPVAGGLLLPHFSLITYRVVFEERERRRVKAVFAKIVSPDVVNELLNAEKLSLGGARRNLTVLFVDVRGFTEFTDLSQAGAEESARQRRLVGREAEEHFDEQARLTLSTANLYLGVIADMVKKHLGTLDKYIGDCVMAFWGAPSPNDQHAVACVKAAIESQRAINAINQQRYNENKRREQENLKRTTAGLDLLPMFPLLSVGCGINTGKMTVGLMGSDAHILNYTVFGREVNVASRLEGIAGRGSIIISEATYADIKRDDPKLAAACVERPAVQVKGIRQEVRIYEVPWKEQILSTTSGDTI